MRHLAICCVALAVAAAFYFGGKWIESGGHRELKADFCDCECDAGRVIVTFEEGKVRIGD